MLTELQKLIEYRYEKMTKVAIVVQQRIVIKIVSKKTENSMKDGIPFLSEDVIR